MGDNPRFVAKYVRQSHIYASTGATSANRSVHSKGSIERVKQSRIAEWLEQALLGTLSSRRGQMASSLSR